MLLDLDGTLVDSAPDLAAALNQLRAEQGLAALALDEVKAMIGDGVSKLVERGHPPAATPADFDRLVERYVALYHARQTALTRPFPGVVENAVREVDGVDDARVDLVWEPPWHQGLISDEAKLALGLL